MASVHAYVCIGGPLNGQYASTEDFRDTYLSRGWDYKRQVHVPRHQVPPGRFHDHVNDYCMFNRSDSGSPTKAIFIYKAWLVPAISAKTGKKVKA